MKRLLGALKSKFRYSQPALVVLDSTATQLLSLG